MRHPIPDFPPLFPCGEWWRLFLAARLVGGPEARAIAEANGGCGLRPRQWMRLEIAGGAVVSLPVSGGASTLKNRPALSWMLAPEARREVRKGALTLATAYGRQPFFHLLEPLLELPDGEMPAASALCMEAFVKVKGVVGLDDESLLDALREGIAVGDPRLRAVAADCRRKFEPGLSIVDLLVRMGPDAIFALITPF